MPRFLHIDNLKKTGLDLNELIIRHPAATFFFRAEGKDESLNISDGDIFIVDRSLSPKYKTLVLAVKDGQIKLQKFSTHISEVWGVVTHIIHKVPQST